MDTKEKYLYGCVFSNGIVLVYEPRDGVNVKLERWRKELESCRLKLSQSKIEFINCKCTTNEISSRNIKLEKKEITPSEGFK